MTSLSLRRSMAPFAVFAMRLQAVLFGWQSRGGADPQL
jgi:hypothetical protein